MRYPGGKNGGGLYQQIICQMPPHRVYVEPFVGSGAVLRMKRPAERSLAIDLDPGAIGRLAGAVPDGTERRIADGIEFLEKWCPPADALIYCDPPYLSTVSPQRYAHKMGQRDHERLLLALNRLSCPILLSGYRSPLYDDVLRHWRRLEFPAWTRGGPAVEVLWCSFPEPRELHDYRYLGVNHRKRLDIRRQQRRWKRRLEQMDRLQRLALMQVLCESFPAADGVSAVAVRDGISAACRSIVGKPASAAESEAAEKINHFFQGG